jgi:hypothetical protein
MNALFDDVLVCLLRILDACCRLRSGLAREDYCGRGIEIHGRDVKQAYVLLDSPSLYINVDMVNE